MAEVLVTFQCSACGKVSDPPFRASGSWFPKRDFLEVMKARGWKITRKNTVLCKDCHVDMLAHNRTVTEEVRVKKLELNNSK